MTAGDRIIRSLDRPYVFARRCNYSQHRYASAQLYDWRNRRLPWLILAHSYGTLMC